jgi:hypothetical protein
MKEETKLKIEALLVLINLFGLLTLTITDFFQNKSIGLLIWGSYIFSLLFTAYIQDQHNNKTKIK